MAMVKDRIAPYYHGMPKRSVKYRSGSRYSCEGRCPGRCSSVRKERKTKDRRARRQDDEGQAELGVATMNPDGCKGCDGPKSGICCWHCEHLFCGPYGDPRVAESWALGR